VGESGDTEGRCSSEGVEGQTPGLQRGATSASWGRATVSALFDVAFNYNLLQLVYSTGASSVCAMTTAEEEGVFSLARVFFSAATKTSDDSEDILPQEVLLLFSERFFPACVGLYTCWETAMG
jgi:hypothetical protein